MVGRRRDETHPRDAVPGLGDVLGHFEAGQLAALARFGPLSHLDLQFVGVGQVGSGHTEPPGRHLLDGGTTVVLWVNIVQISANGNYSKLSYSDTNYLSQTPLNMLLGILYLP